ncbi:hypothetical protein GCM10022247_05310 [Allokutzneria multivorans]|uniref:Uncharacterized protein n=1 Tax=Allokutzneria multivorans TaxID=1142134 RepID=A0ABP7QY18_9PSEU
MRIHFDDADFQLRWPRKLFVAESARLLNQRKQVGWDEACELLLEDAFVGGADGGPSSEFREIEIQEAGQPEDPWSTVARRGGRTPRQEFLRTLMASAGRLREDSVHRKPYWSQRKSVEPPLRIRQESTVRQYVALVHDLDARGYFEKRFGKDCVDDPSSIDPSSIVEQELGVPDLWPLSAHQLTDSDLLCDVIEVLHDLVARPGNRRGHSYGGCGWHHSNFSTEAGRAIYRWRVNQLLDRSELGLRLADDGDDTGRLVAVSDEAREQLLHTLLSRHESETGEQLRHAIALFRARVSDKHKKRSAVVALANILEERRKMIKVELTSKDEDALFQIANKFNIRHQNAAQKKDYGVEFLDWIFWWYLATIDLTDRISVRHHASPDVQISPDSHP